MHVAQGRFRQGGPDGTEGSGGWIPADRAGASILTGTILIEPMNMVGAMAADGGGVSELSLTPIP